MVWPAIKDEEHPPQRIPWSRGEKILGCCIVAYLIGFPLIVLVVKP